MSTAAPTPNSRPSKTPPILMGLALLGAGIRLFAGPRGISGFLTSSQGTCFWAASTRSVSRWVKSCSRVRLAITNLSCISVYWRATAGNCWACSSIALLLCASAWLRTSSSWIWLSASTILWISSRRTEFWKASTCGLFVALFRFCPTIRLDSCCCRASKLLRLSCRDWITGFWSLKRALSSAILLSSSWIFACNAL